MTKRESRFLPLTAPQAQARLQKPILLFVLSRQGQGLFAQHSLLLPLTAPILADQRRKLR
ncbi:MAG TPA: hypothetical protein VIC29_16485 [Steroidobacteraceae bacterium]